MYDIESYVGAGPFRLGITRGEMRAALAALSEPVHEASKAGVLIDVCPRLRVHVHYGRDDRSEFIEFFGQQECNPCFLGRTFLGKSYRAARDWFAKRDPHLSLDGAGLRSERFGIALYAPSAMKTPTRPVTAISIFTRGYYASGDDPLV